MRPLRVLGLSLLVAGCAPFGAGAYPVVYEQPCADAACLEDFVFTDAARWRMREGDHAPALELAGRSDYRPPHRSPLSIALIGGVEVQDFDLDADEAFEEESIDLEDHDDDYDTEGGEEEPVPTADAPADDDLFR